MLFNPSREQVRQFFFDTWLKHRSGMPLAGIEPKAVDVMLLHPEYHALLDAPKASIAMEFTPEEGRMNPFLHMSLHLALAEQVAIDQPLGIREEVERLVRRKQDQHEALHLALDCLGEAVWKSQREGGEPDGAAYLECLRRR